MEFASAPSERGSGVNRVLVAAWLPRERSGLRTVKFGGWPAELKPVLLCDSVTLW